VTADLMNTVITDLATLEKLPVGAVLIDDEGIAWQKDGDGWWEARKGRINPPYSLVAENKSLLVAWLPPEVAR